MSKPKRHRRIIYRVEVDAATYGLIRAMAVESKRPEDELIAMAARLLRAATPSLFAMHPPDHSKTPLTPAQRAQHIARTKAKNQAPRSVADVLKSMANKERNTR